MAKDFSWKLNDKRAVLVADKIRSKFPEDPSIEGSWATLCDYLATIANVSYADTMTMLSRLQPLTSDPKDVFRVSLAILGCRDPQPAKGKSVQAHARVLQISVNDKQSRFPKISFRLLVCSGAHAGRYLEYQCSLSEAVKLHKAVYSGRSKRLSGRSLLEFVGCVVSVYIRDSLVIGITATPEEKKINKALCEDRCQADTACHEAQQCCLCKKGRSQCRMAVRM